jgi:AcrR family transcriptional regulator
MARAKRDTKSRLLDAGLALAREKSFGAVSVREVCRRAAVNLGLFHYNFKNRETFRRCMLEAGYLRFFADLALSSDESGRPPEKLRRALGVIARFSREHRRMLAGIFRDALNGDRQIATFAAKSFHHHLPLVFGLYRDGVEAGDFRKISEPTLLAFLLGVINAPGLMLTLFEEHGARRPLGRERAAIEAQLLSEWTVEERLDLVMAALAAPRKV